MKEWIDKFFFDLYRLENLFQRYEEPNNAVRWDSPLFFVPWSDDSLPLDKIFEAITSGKIKPQTTATLPVSFFFLFFVLFAFYMNAIDLVWVNLWYYLLALY